MENKNKSTPKLLGLDFDLTLSTERVYGDKDLKNAI